MKSFHWNSEKSKQLQAERDISFDAVVEAIKNGDILDVIEHPNQDKYPSQKIFIVEIKQYVYIVPFVENSQEIFLNWAVRSLSSCPCIK